MMRAGAVATGERATKFRRSERTESRPQPARISASSAPMRKREIATDKGGCPTDAENAMSLSGDIRARGFRLPR